MHHFLFLAGPPAGQRMWDLVLRRVRSEGAQATAVDLLDLNAESEDPTGWAAALADRIRATEDCILVAHGTAVPLARHAAALHPPAGLVLSNGPLGPLSRTARALCRAARCPGGGLWARPELAIPWLASSAGLRRTVVNPYVWDRDTVVTVCGPLFADRTDRRRTLRFMSALPALAESPPDSGAPTALLWGDADPLFSSLNLDHFSDKAHVILVEGGHHYHPLERPWAIADGVLGWAQETLTTT